VGGQGTLLAADVIALVGMEQGHDVKKSEVHGMAQRGGSVTSHVRWGKRVYSPVIGSGEVDYFVAFERLEALRYAHMLRPEGTLLINDYRISPVSVSSGDDLYPTPAQEELAYQPLAGRVHYVPAIDLARELGNPRVNNVVMLGALSALLNVPQETWLAVVARRVPERYVELNQRAFIVGRERMMDRLSGGGERYAN
ncbi:MAG: indolepyruvate oxidoreductase subunit beta, partial [Chloroflexi bacterium]|nr:indolepyruvate oxidoreductase subunit beta [Chloroflexota bacterium]